jgi:hypothetical protein
MELTDDAIRYVFQIVIQEPSFIGFFLPQIVYLLAKPLC